MIINATFEKPLFDTPLRTYVFLHTYFKSLLNGVQGGHACVELSVKYDPDSPQGRMYRQWACVDKTLVFLDGGVSLHLHTVLDQLQSLGEHGRLAWAPFHEDKDTLEGMLTAVSILLPESIAKAEPLDWLVALSNRAGPIYNDLLKLGMEPGNSKAFVEVIDWLRRRPLAS